MTSKNLVQKYFVQVYASLYLSFRRQQTLSARSLSSFFLLPPVWSSYPFNLSAARSGEKFGGPTSVRLVRYKSVLQALYRSFPWRRAPWFEKRVSAVRICMSRFAITIERIRKTRRAGFD
jgi:hypothetical protein